MHKKIHAVYIGFPKCASTWFHRFCEESPDLAVSKAKDIRFFSENYIKGEDWFFRQLVCTSQKSLAVEVNHDYIFSKQAMVNIKNTSPEAKLIIFLRHPIDWLISEYNYVTAVANVNCSFCDFLIEYPYAMERCKYEIYFSHMFELFPKENVFIEFQENLKSNPVEFSQNLCSFLSISTEFLSSFDSKRQVNAKMKARYKFVPLATKIAKNIFLRMGFDGLYGRLKRSKVRSIIFKDNSYSPESFDNNLTKELLDWSIRRRNILEDLVGENIDAWREREVELLASIERSRSSEE